LRDCRLSQQREDWPAPFQAGAPDTIRTCDLCLRRATLYPAELRVLDSVPLADWPRIGNALAGGRTPPGGRSGRLRRLVARAMATGRTHPGQMTTNSRHRTIAAGRKYPCARNHGKPECCSRPAPCPAGPIIYNSCTKRGGPVPAAMVGALGCRPAFCRSNGRSIPRRATRWCMPSPCGCLRITAAMGPRSRASVCLPAAPSTAMAAPRQTRRS
jgi:hypothetical protein